MRALLIALCLALAMPAAAFRPTLTAGGATAGSGGGGGGGGGAFAFVASASGAGDTPAATTVATSSTLNVEGGDLLIAWVTFEDGTGADAISITDGGSNTFTFDTGDDTHGLGNTANGYPLYILNASANSSATFTATITESGSPSSKSYRRIIVMQYRSGGTITKDISGTPENDGEGTAIASGSFSTTGTNGVVCGAAAVYTSGTHSSQTVGGVAAENAVSQSGASMWCDIVTAALTTQTADSTYSASNYWAATAIAFKSE